MIAETLDQSMVDSFTQLYRKKFSSEKSRRTLAAIILALSVGNPTGHQFSEAQAFHEKPKPVVIGMAEDSLLDL